MDRWHRWHADSHIPDIIKQLGFVKVTKYRRTNLISDKVEFWTIYEMQDREALGAYDQSDAAKKLRSNHEAKFGSSTRLEPFVIERELEVVVS